MQFQIDVDNQTLKLNFNLRGIPMVKSSLFITVFYLFISCGKPVKHSERSLPHTPDKYETIKIDEIEPTLLKLREDWFEQVLSKEEFKLVNTFNKALNNSQRKEFEYTNFNESKFKEILKLLRKRANYLIYEGSRFSVYYGDTVNAKRICETNLIPSFGAKNRYVRIEFPDDKTCLNHLNNLSHITQNIEQYRELLWLRSNLNVKLGAYIGTASDKIYNKWKLTIIFGGTPPHEHLLKLFEQLESLENFNNSLSEKLEPLIRVEEDKITYDNRNHSKLLDDTENELKELEELSTDEEIYSISGFYESYAHIIEKIRAFIQTGSTI